MFPGGESFPHLVINNRILCEVRCKPLCSSPINRSLDGGSGIGRGIIHKRFDGRWVGRKITQEGLWCHVKRQMVGASNLEATAGNSHISNAFNGYINVLKVP